MVTLYQETKSPVHSVSVLIKILALIAVTSLLSPPKPLTLALFFLGAVTLFFLSRVRMRLLPPLLFRGLAILLFLIAANTLSFFGWSEALLRTGKYLLLFLLSLLMVMTSSPTSIASELYATLRPFRFLPVRTLCVLLGLTLNLIPLLFREISEIQESIRSRGGGKGLSPLRSIHSLAIPLFAGVLRKSDELSEAMESRLFHEEATLPQKSREIKRDLRDIFSLFVVLGVGLWLNTL